jgi:hypothetical protein
MNNFSKRFTMMILVLGTLLAVPAWSAGITVSAGSVTVAPGPTLDTLEVDLMNTGPSAATIGGFSFELSVATPTISFTGVTTSTTMTYIFSGNSLFGPILTGPVSGQTISAADIASTPFTGTSINRGATVGLGQATFNVAANASGGQFVVNIVTFPNTSLSDALGNNVAVSTYSNGQITISEAPEPPSALLCLLLIPFAMFQRVRSIRGRV